MGIEPTSSAWKAEALPLSYARIEITIILELNRKRQGYLCTFTKSVQENPAPPIRVLPQVLSRDIRLSYWPLP